VVRSLLVRGMLAGLAAGVLAFAFAFVFGEPQVQRAIDFEQTLGAHDPEVVSRGVQRTLGLLTGTVVMGVALGGLFSLVFAYAYGRLSTLNARATSALLAGAEFLTVTAIPFTKYPANPPTVGNPDTIDKRTMLFLAMIAITVLAAIAAVRIRRDLLRRTSGWNATLLAVAAFVVVIAIAQLILPAVHETPPGFPADVLYRFRLASLGINLTLWATIGLGFGALAEKLILERQHALTTASKRVGGLTH
jgi:putative cobalt transporter subunit CbtA